MHRRLEGARTAVARAARSSVAATAAAVRRLVAQVVAAAVTAFAAPPPVRSWPLRTRGRWTGRPRDLVVLVDVAVAVLVVATTAAALAERNDQLSPSAGDPALGPLVVLMGAFALGVPMLLRERAPVAAWRLTVAVLVVSAGVLGPLMPVVLLPPHLVVAVITTYTVVVRADRPVALGVAMIAGVATGIANGVHHSPGTALRPEGWVAILLLLAVPVVLGHNVRARRGTQAALADEQRRGDAVRAERAVLEERARIARELHDVVAHHMTLVAIQAEAGPLRSGGDAAALAEELGAIRRTALAALTETRRILGVLRDDDADGGVAPPMPGLAAIDDLVTAAREAGHAVTVDVAVTDADVTPGLALTVHRVVQESLSNVLRHAPGAPITVTVARGDDRDIDVHVVNGPATGPPAAAATEGGGHGQLGMRERVAMLDGRIEVGPTADGGYAVRACLPEGRR